MFQPLSSNGIGTGFHLSLSVFSFGGMRGLGFGGFGLGGVCFRGLSLGGVGAVALASVAFVSVALAAVESAWLAFDLMASTSTASATDRCCGLCFNGLQQKPTARNGKAAVGIYTFLQRARAA